MAQDFQSHKQKIYQQVQEQYGKLVYTYTCHLKRAATLKKESNRFKWAQIILSAISTGGFIATVVTDQAKLAWIGGIVSTLLLVVSGYLKDKDFAAEQKSHIDTASKLWPIREEYLSLLTDFDELSEEDIVGKRDKLMSRTAKVYENAPQTDEKAYADAQDALKNKEEQFFTQEELNVMLPAHLRK
ncbi:MAG: SLATT domain-containing protein [Butyrivibrio sp.]|nr:SLATT domain-containing protein [Butyrivibrio sp.]